MGELDIRSSTVRLRFAVGDLRFATVHLPVREVFGHFLERPIRVTDLFAAHQREHTPVFGRSVLMGDTPDHRVDALPDHASVLLAYRRHYVTLDGDFPTYLGRFSSRTRSTLQRKVRKFEALSQGRIDWVTFRTPDDVASFLSEAIPLSKRTYQHRLFHSGLPESDVFRTRLENLAVEGKWRAWILRLDQQPVAYICAPAVGRTLLYDFVGFDPQHASASPGSVLQYLVLEQLFRERQFAFFDFTEGEGEHKALFGTDHRPCADILITGSAIRPRLLVAAHRLFTATARAIVTGVEKAGLKTRLRKLMRR